MRTSGRFFFMFLVKLLLVPLALFLPMTPLTTHASTNSQFLQKHTPHVFYQRGKSPVQVASSSSSSGNLTYHGGSVMGGTTSVYAIYWQPTDDVSANYQSLINRYFGDVGNSSLYALLAQYPQSGGSVPVNSILSGTWTDHRPYPESPLQDGDIQHEVSYALNVNNTWIAGSNSIFFVFTQRHEDICSNGIGCASTTICGYHNSFGGNVIYAAVPYAASFNCKSGSSPNNDDADQTINVASHEQVEAANDPFSNAWYDSGGQEIGDKCAWTFGSRNGAGADVLWDENDYFVQEEWDNASSNCLLGLAGTRGASQAVSQTNGTVDTFFTGTDGALYHAWYTVGMPWNTTSSMPGTAPMGSEPSAVNSSPGVVDVFWKGADANLWHVYYQPGIGWTSAAQSLGDGPLGGPPKAVAESNGNIEVFWRGTDNNIWHGWYNPGLGWRGPEQITSTGNVSSDPAPVRSTSATWDVFWKGSDANLWHVYWAGGSGWYTQNLGDGPLGGSPQAIGESDGWIEVVWRGLDNNVWHGWYTPGLGWRGPEQITSTGNVTADPAPANSNQGTWDVFWKGSDANLWHVYWPGGPHWYTQNLGFGPLGGAPTVTGQGNAIIDVFWKGTDGGVWHAWYNQNHPWAGPQSLGGSVA